MLDVQIDASGAHRLRGRGCLLRGCLLRRGCQIGEDLADGLPLFEMVLGSLDETLAPHDGTEAPVAEPAGETDPFADIDLSDLEVAPR